MKTHILILCLILLLATGATESQQENQFLARRVAILETQVNSLLRRVEKLETQSLKSTQPKTTSKAKPSGDRGPTLETKGFGPILEVGQIAYLNGNHDTGTGIYVDADARVQEIIDATNMIVQITIGYKAHYPDNSPIGRSNYTTGVHIPYRHTSITKDVWIRGLSTTGLVDRSQVKYAAPLEITGTKTYTEWGDRTTLFVLEPVGKTSQL